MESLFIGDTPMPDSDCFPLTDLELEKEIESIAISELNIQQIIEEDEANLFGFNESAMFVAALPEESEPQLQELTKELTTESNEQDINLQLINVDDPINDSIPKLQDDSTTTYESNTVVDFPLINSKWCCKCDLGPPSVNIDDTIVKCTICNKHWGCRSCYDIKTVEHEEKTEEIVRCPKCEVTKLTNDQSPSSSDTISSESGTPRQTPKFNENPIPRRQSLEPVQHQMVSYIHSSQPALNPVIIFDFDDTLFPTTKYNEISARPENDPALAKWGCKGVFYKFESAEERLEWHNLSVLTLKLLESYIKQYGKARICIASSSSKEWIKHALSSVHTIGFYAQIYELLFDESKKKDDDDVITFYHPEPRFPHPDQMLTRIMYKNANKSENVLNTFVVIGDSMFSDEGPETVIEYIFGKNSKNVCIDRYKLEPKPTIRTLAEEQNVLLGLCKERYHLFNALVRNKLF